MHTQHRKPKEDEMGKDHKNQVDDAGSNKQPTGSSPGPAMPKIGLDGNPIGGMAHLFSDTAAMAAAEKAEDRGVGGGNEDGLGGSGQEEPGKDDRASVEKMKEETKEEISDEGLGKSKQEEEEKGKEEPEKGEQAEGKEDKKYQALYDRTKQELELSREIAADATDKALKQEKELERLRKLEDEVVPHLPRLKTQLDVETALRDVQVPPENWTGDDGKGNAVCTNGDKLSYLMAQKPELLVDLIEKAADRAADRRLTAMEAARAKRSEIETRFEARHKVELSQHLINSINAKLSDGAKRVICNVDIPDDVKDDIIDQAYSKVAAEGKSTPPIKDAGKEKEVAEEKTVDELRAETEKREIEEKRAALLRSKSNLNQSNRTTTSAPIDATQKAYDEMKAWQKKTKGSCPLL